MALQESLRVKVSNVKTWRQ